MLGIEKAYLNDDHSRHWGVKLNKFSIGHAVNSLQQCYLSVPIISFLLKRTDGASSHLQHKRFYNFSIIFYSSLRMRLIAFSF